MPRARRGKRRLVGTGGYQGNMTQGTRGSRYHLYTRTCTRAHTHTSRPQPVPREPSRTLSLVARLSPFRYIAPMAPEEAKAVVMARLGKDGRRAGDLLMLARSDPELMSALLAGCTPWLRARLERGQQMTERHAGQALWRLGISSSNGPGHVRWWGGQ